MAIRVNENKLQLISPGTKLGFKNMLYKKASLPTSDYFRLGLSILNIALNQAVLPQHTLNRRRQVKQGRDAVYQGSDSTDKLILKTNAWCIILNCKLTFRRRRQPGNGRVAVFFTAQWRPSLSLGTPSKNSTTSYGIHLKRL